MMIEMKVFDENTGKLVGAVTVQGTASQANLLRVYRALHMALEDMRPEFVPGSDPLASQWTYKEPE